WPRLVDVAEWPAWLCLAHWGLTSTRTARGATGMVPAGYPRGVTPAPAHLDRYVMRLPDPVRVLGSMRPEDCPTREHAPRGVREISSCRTPAPVDERPGS